MAMLNNQRVYIYMYSNPLKDGKWGEYHLSRKQVY